MVIDWSKSGAFRISNIKIQDNLVFQLRRITFHTIVCGH